MSEVYVKTRILCGESGPKFLKDIENKSIFIVCDKFLQTSGLVNYVIDKLDSSNSVFVFDEVVPDPTIDSVTKGLVSICKVNPDVVIGFGGGSPIDTAKAILQFAKEKSLIERPLFVAIPTTSGTGSEVTVGSVIKDEEKGIKHLLVSEDLLPDIALLDATLTLSIPKHITAHTGMDVLTHAIEAYVSKSANTFTDALAEKAVSLAFSNLLTCFNDGQNLEARTLMHEASTLAGMAFSNSGLGLNHAIAHQLGGVFHVPHGHANAMLLTKIIDFNCQDDKARKKYAQLACQVNLASTDDCESYKINVLKEAIATLLKIMNVPYKISELGIDQNEYKNNISKMCDNALNDTCMESNPILVNKEDIANILINIY